MNEVNIIFICSMYRVRIGALTSPYAIWKRVLRKTFRTPYFMSCKAADYFKVILLCTSIICLPWFKIIIIISVFLLHIKSSNHSLLDIISQNLLLLISSSNLHLLREDLLICFLQKDNQLLNLLLHYLFMANAKLCCNFTTILIIFLVMSRSSCARPLLNEGLLASESSPSIVESNRKVKNGHLNLLLHRLPKGKVPASAPGKRTHSNNN